MRPEPDAAVILSVLQVRANLHPSPPLRQLKPKLSEIGRSQSLAVELRQSYSPNRACAGGLFTGLTGDLKGRASGSGPDATVRPCKAPTFHGPALNKQARASSMLSSLVLLVLPRLQLRAQVRKMRLFVNFKVDGPDLVVILQSIGKELGLCRTSQNTKRRS